MCWYGVYIDLTDDSHGNNDNLRRRGIRCSVKSDTKRIWTPCQEISCDTELYHEFEFVVNLRYSANAFWKICVGESKKTHFWIVSNTFFRIESEPGRIWLHPGNSNYQCTKMKIQTLNLRYGADFSDLEGPERDKALWLIDIREGI